MIVKTEPLWSITLVGCGGTGSILAEALCRLLPPDKEITLVDYDRIEPRNLIRQNFHPDEVGQFKSEALARRLARIYERPIRYSVYPYATSPSSLAIGCVDGAAGRKALADRAQDWWLDAGNGYHSGQIFIGNAWNRKYMLGCCHGNTITAVPTPNWQEPALLIPAVVVASCAEAVEAGDQSPSINQVMAAITLEMVRRLFDGTLNYMAAYVDLEMGHLQYVPIELRRISEITGVEERELKRPIENHLTIKEER